MKSISSITLLAATSLLGLASAQYKTLVYKGCFSSSEGLSLNTSYIYNTKGYCQTQCVPAQKIVQATSNSEDCWCGDEIPPSSDLVDDSKCNSPCAGYDQENCGGVKYWSVYLTGLATTAPNADASSAASSSSSVAPTSTTSAKPSVVTVGGETVTVQASSAAAASSSAAAIVGSKKSGPSKAGIAAGVVVGVVAASAIAGGIFLFMRNRKRRQVEDEYRRNAAVSNFVAGGKAPGSSGGNSFIDTRLDPTLAQRRMSDGSIADNEDYSRRILKVTNA